MGYVGIYAGNGSMLNATSSKGVRFVDFRTGYWQSRFMGIRRIIPEYVTIGRSDTLWRLSNQYGVTIAELKVWNKLQSDMIWVGQTLYIANPNYTQS
jgi:ribosomal protein L16 Arg81 hydroxylase